MLMNTTSDYHRNISADNGVVNTVTIYHKSYSSTNPVKINDDASILTEGGWRVASVLHMTCASIPQKTGPTRLPHAISAITLSLGETRWPRLFRQRKFESRIKEVV